MNLEPKQLFIFAGEPSGDLHGSTLVRALRQQNPQISFEGVAGPKMRAEGISGFLSMEDFQVMGFSDVLWSLPRLLRHFRRIKESIIASKPDGVVLIDYATFNMKMAKALRKEGYQGKIIHYISPSVWAWGKHRIQALAETLDLLLCIYPFEPSHFAHTSLPAIYIGNPLSEYLKNHNYDSAVLTHPHLIALFPGSRAGEVKHNLPIMLEAAQSYHQRHPDAVFGISCAHPDTEKFLNNYRKQHPGPFASTLISVDKEYSYELMKNSCAAMAKSGTITLELALHHCPTIVIYKLTRLNRLYAKYILKLNLPYYCIVNILANQQIFPELIENGLSADHLFQLLEKINSDEAARSQCIDACKKLSSSLQTHLASQKAAEEIFKVLS